MARKQGMIEELRKKIPGEEFDYPALLDGLKEYRRPDPEGPDRGGYGTAPWI